MIRRIIVLILVFLLTTIALAAESAVVRIGDRCFSVEEVQRYVEQAAINLRMVAGTEISLIYENEQEFFTEAAEHFVTKTILEDKFAEYGVDKLSAEEEQSLRLAAQKIYEQIWQAISDLIKKNYPDITGGDRVATETMESAGYTMEELYNSERRELLQERLMEKLCLEPNVAIEDAKAWYLENQVTPCRERYENNVPLFEQEVLLADGSSAYVPDGYFYVKYILLQPDGEIADALAEAQMKVEQSEIEKQSAYDALAQAALLENGDTADVRTRYHAAEQACEEAARAIDDAMQAAEQAFLPMANVVQTAMNDGISFEELIERYSVTPAMGTVDEPGFPFHPDSEMWDARIRDAVSELKQYGACTEPIYSSNYVYIVSRMDDMACGAYEPSNEELEEIRNDLLIQKQMEQMDALVQEWRTNYEIFIDVSQLVMP